LPTLKTTKQFDSYADSVREASLHFIKTGPSRARWGIEWYPLSRLNLQLGNDGGARVVHGIGREDAITFIFQIGNPPRRVFFDGYDVKWNEICVISPGAHFTFASKTQTQWIALTVSSALIEEVDCIRQLEAVLGKSNALISLTKNSAKKFITITKRVRNRARLSTQKKMPVDVAAFEAILLTALTEALTSRTSKIRQPGRHQTLLHEKISKAIVYVRSRYSKNIQVEELACVTGVNTRALHRYFQTYLRMAPKEYLKFRRLNLVRRSLRLDPVTEGVKNHITRVLVNYGVTELGRFAVEYRRLFHESPSETFARR
jgi:methylphosphotriester-DNA--protein-cysteine methyltransferase